MPSGSPASFILNKRRLVSGMASSTRGASGGCCFFSLDSVSAAATSMAWLGVPPGGGVTVPHGGGEVGPSGGGGTTAVVCALESANRRRRRGLGRD